MSRVLTGAALAAVTTCGCAAAPSTAAIGRPRVALAVADAPQSGARSEIGLASWYGEAHQGRLTASGEVFDMTRLTAAHRTLPLSTWVEVKNLDNGRSVVVRVNDRGPFAQTHERIIDVSLAAARVLGLVGAGTAPVQVRVVPPPTTPRS